MTSWKKVTLQDVFNFTNGKGIKKSLINDTGKYPVMGANGVIGYTEDFLYDHPINIIGRVGSSGEIHRSNSPCWVSDNAIIAVGKDNLDDLFGYYLLKGTRIKQVIIGSTQPLLTQSGLNIIPVSIPPLVEQKKIANFLSILDQKIELNQQMNETLEEIAKTLFKSWFIDFDPVKAKAEGRPAGLSKEISDFFPGSFEDSELGEVPKGWKLLTFGDFVKPNRGKIITKKTTAPGSVPVVAGGLEPAYFHSTANVQGPVVTISASGANAGYVNLYHQDIWASDCSYISNNQTSNVFTSYIFLKINQRRIFDSQHGAAQPHVYPDDLKRLHMFSPDKDLFSIYENLVTPFFNKIKLNKDQSDNLISLRDTLLPKLISGELMVSEIESLTEEASV